MDCAKLNLQRSLAIDDAYMPAFNQLALYYFQLAKKRAGAVKASRRAQGPPDRHERREQTKRADVQQLELAALVCSQAIRKNPNYAPIHNTAGLIQNELGQVNGAVQEFSDGGEARSEVLRSADELRARSTSASAASSRRESAYKKALDDAPERLRRPLGMALAIRGPITGAEDELRRTLVAAVAGRARRGEEDRPEPPGRLLQRGHPHAGVQGDAGRRQGEDDRFASRTAKKIFQTVPREGRGQAPSTTAPPQA